MGSAGATAPVLLPVCGSALPGQLVEGDVRLCTAAGSETEGGSGRAGCTAQSRVV